MTHERHSAGDFNGDSKRWRSRQNGNNLDCPSLDRIGGRYGGATEVAPVWRLLRELQLQRRVPMPRFAQRAFDDAAEPGRV